jgi:hypothetical protein
MNQKTLIIEEARRLVKKGIFILPIKISKTPLISGWGEDTWKMPLPQYKQLFQDGAQLAIITGKRSDITVVDIDLETPDTFGTDPNTFPDTYTVQTPSGGLQKYYKYNPDVHQSQKALSKYPCVDIRNDGGYVAAPPSHLTYTKNFPNGEVKDIDGVYTVLSGTWGEFAELPTELFVQEEEPSFEYTLPTKSDRPGDDFDRSVTWEQLLTPLGWMKGYTDRVGTTHWTRPGKKGKVTSATTRIIDGIERLFVWSTNGDPFEPYEQSLHNSYTKTSAYAKIHHNGDFKEAIKALKEQGYGVKTTSTQDFPTTEPTPETEEKTYTHIDVKNIISLPDLKTKEFPPEEFVLYPFFEKNAINLISAPPNNWKSWVLFDMVRAISEGKEWIDHHKTEKHKVLIINEEDTLPRVKERMDILKASSPDLYFYVMNGFKLGPETVKSIIQYCKDNTITVVAFDSLRAVHLANENDSTAMQEVLEHLKTFIRNGITVIATHHHKKKPRDGERIDEAEAIRGSTAISAAISGHISLEEVVDDTGIKVIVKHLKSKATEKMKPFEVKVNKTLDSNDKVKHIVLEYGAHFISRLYAVDTLANEIVKELELNKEKWHSIKSFSKLGGDRNIREAVKHLADRGMVHVSNRGQIGTKAVGNGAKNERFYCFREEQDEEQKRLEDAFDKF